MYFSKHNNEPHIHMGAQRVRVTNTLNDVNQHKRRKKNTFWRTPRRRKKLYKANRALSMQVILQR